MTPELTAVRTVSTDSADELDVAECCEEGSAVSGACGDQPCVAWAQASERRARKT